MTQFFQVVAAAIIALAAAGDRPDADRSTPAVSPQGARPNSRVLDDQLLRDLGRRSAQLPGESRPSTDPGKLQQPAAPSRVQPVEPFARGEDIGSVASPEVVKSIEQRMLEAQQRLREQDTSKATQEIQRQIVLELDTVIHQLQEQMASQSSSGQQAAGTGQQGQPSGKDGGETGDRRSPGNSEQPPTTAGGTTETDAMRQALDRFWGNLPERVRSQVQNMNAVEFLPEYEKLIEDYYRRLAEDQGR